MNRNYYNLKNFLETKSSALSKCRSVTIDSLKELLNSETGRVYTGICFTKPLKLKHGTIEEHFRDVWTDEVAEVLDWLNIQYVKGYDYDKAGANGAYVQVKDSEFWNDPITAAVSY